MHEAYTINNDQEAIRELLTIRSCFKPISAQYQALSWAIRVLEKTNREPYKPESEE